MHKSKEDVAKLYNVKFGTPPDSSPKELTLFTRKKLREKFVNADIGITGANFLVADIGAVALTVCGACSEICPVKVPLHDMLLLNRKKFVEGGHENKFWNSGMHFFKGIALKRSNLDLINGELKNIGLKTIGRVLGNNKKNPQFAKQSFNQLRKDKNN